MKTYGTLSFNKKKNRFDIVVEPHVAIRLKRVFAKIDTWQYGTQSISATPENCLDLQWFLDRYPLQVSEEAGTVLQVRADKYQEQVSLVDKLLSGAVPSPQFQLKLPLREYQALAANLWLETGRLLLADDVGLGKTAEAIAGLTNPRLLPALVVTLTHLPRQWEEQIHKFTDLTTHILKKGTPYDFLPMCGGKIPDVIISNYHKLSGWAETLAPICKSFIIDECHELRHRTSQKYKAAKHVADGVDFRIGLSATPIFGYGGELYNVLDVISPGTLGTWAEFEREWCTYQQQKPKFKDPAAFGKYAQDTGLILRRTRKDVKRELPEVTVVPHYIDADLKVLDEMKGQAIELAKLIVSQAPQDFKGQRMQASGQFNMKMRQACGIAKAPYVAEFIRMLIESSDEPVIVGLWHRECFGASTPIMMYDGSIKPVEEVIVGDVVMGPDSSPRNVLNLTHGHGPLYEVTPIKGDAWTCSENHVMALHHVSSSRKGNNPYKNFVLSKFLKKKEDTRKTYTLYRSEAITFPNQTTVFEPWFVGYWLGDGASSLNDVRVVTEDMEIFQEVGQLCEKYGLTMRQHPSLGKTGKSRCQWLCCSSSRGTSLKWHRNPVLNALKEAGLKGYKHIPASYKTASIEQRRELLAGLLDSDGHVFHGNSAGSADIQTKWEHLADDIVFLCRSIGLAAYKSSTTRITNYHPVPTLYYRVSISGDLTVIPTKIARKKPPIRRQIKSVLHTGFSVKEKERGEFFGFEVDGDNLFLLGDFTVVHNCYDILMQELKDFNPVMFSGTESAVQKEVSKQKFLKGESKVMLLSLRSGAGMDGLQDVCHLIVIAELDWAHSALKQFIGRVHRDGQDDPVTAYYLLAEHGSDPFMADLLGIKKQQLEGVINPTQVIVEETVVEDNYVRQMAQRFLTDHGIELPEKVGEASKDDGGVAAPSIGSGGVDTTVSDTGGLTTGG